MPVIELGEVTDVAPFSFSPDAVDLGDCLTNICSILDSLKKRAVDVFTRRNKGTTLYLRHILAGKQASRVRALSRSNIQIEALH